jgi:hypothetical protein
VQIDYNVVHLRTSLVQLFVLFLQNFEKVIQMIELKRFGGAPNGYPFAPLWALISEVQLFEQEDAITWKWTGHGTYTAKSAYAAQLAGSFCSFYSRPVRLAYQPQPM